MADHATIEAAGTEVRISNPQKVFFAERGITTLDVVNFSLERAEPVINQLRDRPTVLKRFVNGAAQPPFFQKRIPDAAPEWLEAAALPFPSRRPARGPRPHRPA